MAEVDRKITVKLSEDDIKDAVQSWLNSNISLGDYFFTEENISVSVGEEKVGYGNGESVRRFVKIVAEI